MAKLKKPTRVYRFGKGKWHFKRVAQNPRQAISAPLSVCALILWTSEVEKASVRSVRAEDICKKCLGPLEASDG